MSKTITIEIPVGYKAVKTDNGYKFEPDKGMPKTWRECAERLVAGQVLYYFSTTSEICPITTKDYPFNDDDRTSLPTKNIAKAMLALCQLLVAREVYRDGWEPDWTDGKTKYAIYFSNGEICKCATSCESYILTFQSLEIRAEFYKNFQELIIEAQELL